MKKFMNIPLIDLKYGKALKGHVIYMVYSFAMEPMVSFNPLQYHTNIYELCTLGFYKHFWKKIRAHIKDVFSFINR
jgi:hypothetical protein